MAPIHQVHDLLVKILFGFPHAPITKASWPDRDRYMDLGRPNRARPQLVRHWDWHNKFWNKKQTLARLHMRVECPRLIGHDRSNAAAFFQHAGNVAMQLGERTYFSAACQL